MSKFVKRTAEDYYEESLSIEAILHLDSIIGIGTEGRILEAFSDLCDDFPEEILRELFDGSDIDFDVDDVAEDKDTFLELLSRCGKSGFLVNVATPVRRYTDKNGSYSMSWGIYQTAWLYAPTFEAIEERAFKWVEEMIAEYKAASQGKKEADSEL